MNRCLSIVMLLLLSTPAVAADHDDFFSDQVIGPITIEGNSSTATSLILLEMFFHEGDPLDFDQVDATWEHLEDLGWFAFVDISMDDSLDVVPVTLTVEEDSTTRGYPIIDYDRRYDILLGLRAYDINLGGRGEKVSFSGIWHRSHRYEFSWVHPWLFTVKGLSLGVDARWENAPFVYRDFDHRNWNTGLRLRWAPRGAAFVEVGVARGSFEQKGLFDGAPITWAAGTRNRWSTSGTLGLDTRDISWYPTAGGYHRLTATRHESDDFPSFTELVADLRQFISLPWEHVIAVHAWGREVNGHVPPEDMLFWGGPENLRGYRYAQLEAEEGWLLSAEYRWPLFLMPISADGKVVAIGLHIFGDMGAADFDEITGVTRHDFGAGIHLGISDHVFRFEAARTDEDRTAFVFMDSFNF